MERATTKVTVNLPDKTLDKLKHVASDRGISVTEALRQAIETDAFFREEVDKKGSQIVLERSDDTKSVVVLR